MRLTLADPDQIEAIEVQDRVRFPGADVAPRGTVWWVLDGDPGRGYCGARIEGQTVHLERSYVAPSLRRQGIQRAMIRRRVAWGRRKGATRAVTYTWGGNVPSMRALCRAGFVPFDRHWDGVHSWIQWEKT